MKKIDRRFKVLITSTIIFIVGMMSCSPKLFALGTTQYVLICGYNIMLMLKDSHTSISGIGNTLYDKGIEEAKKNKPSAVIYLIAFPMMVTGLLVVIMDIIFVWCLAFK
jgi:hypothetical protein